MESSYYTPSIEEFHSMFRFHILREGKYEPFTFDYKTMWRWGRNNTLYIGVEEGTIKVKHLDQEDIEELGWVFSLIDSDIYDHYYFYKGTETFLLKHYVEGGIVRIIHKSGVESSHVLFFGRIRNYNELATVLSQIK